MPENTTQRFMQYLQSLDCRTSSQEVEQEANTLDTSIKEEEIAQNRRDFRTVPTFTIDPADAKDFDDALSLQQLENGNWEVGVHIAM